jgi:integrase
MSVDGGRAVAASIAAWRPAADLDPAAVGFARAVVARAAPATRDRANALLWAAARLAAWGIPLGYEPVAEVLLHPSTVERFAAYGLGLSPGSRRTLRTNLRFLGRAVVPALCPTDAPLPRSRAKAPYTAAEIAGFLALADAQPTMERRMRASALVCLGAGAGLIRADLRAVRGCDVRRYAGGLVVDVAGARARTVPVLARYQPRLAAAAAFAGDGLLTGGVSVSRQNVTTPLISALAGGRGLPRLDTSRLRATWLTETAALIGLPTFLHAAGIACCQHLGDLAAGLDPGSPAQAVALLGARPAASTDFGGAARGGAARDGAARGGAPR